MAHGFDPVAVGVEQECSVIGRVIVAQARRAVVAAAGGDPGIPEGVDLGPPFRLEAPVPTGGVFGFRAVADRDVDADPDTPRARSPYPSQSSRRPTLTTSSAFKIAS